MNERIRELAEQAGVGSWGINSDNSTEIFQKFSELIVRECAELCLQEANKSENNVWEQIRAKCDAQMILNHFGVEE